MTINACSQRAYFIGIAGKTMGQLAKAFRDIGWEVSGSDKKEIYPPISTYLKKNNIPYAEGYRAENVPSRIDLVVVGRSALLVDAQNPEYFAAKNKNFSVVSYPEVLRDFLVKKNSIVVAGTFGKTTISSLVSFILINAGLNPSYMTGGIPLSMRDGVKITDSDYSVVEGDETPSLLENDPPKFLFYKPKYLLLTATIRDHPEIYKTRKSYVDAFIKLVKLLPVDGLLVYNKDGVDKSVVDNAACKKVSYSLNNKKADYFIKKIIYKKNKTVFEVKSRKQIFSLETGMWGSHNLENSCASLALCIELGIDPLVIASSIKNFKGTETRLELLGKFAGRILYQDYAQHPYKAKSSLEALRLRHPKAKIFCVFDPAATALKYKDSLPWYNKAFDKAEQVIVAKVNFLRNIEKNNRVTGNDIVKAISVSQRKVVYQPLAEKLIDFLVGRSKKNDVIVFMSSGGLRFSNLIRKTVSILKTIREN